MVGVRSVQLMVEEARRRKCAVAIMLLDLENAFGSTNPEVLFDSLHKVFGVDAGVASFIAYTTIHRTQIFDASLEKQA